MNVPGNGPFVKGFLLFTIVSTIGCAKVDIEMSQTAVQYGVDRHVKKKGGPELLLELDTIAGAEAVTVKSDGLTLEQSYCMPDARGDCRGLVVRVEKGEPVTDPRLGTAECLWPAELDQQLGCTRDLLPAPGQWYAHGLVTPTTRRKTNARGRSYCENIRGTLWSSGAACDLPGKESDGHEEGIRQDFLVFHSPGDTDDELMATTVHELLHVLNIHHEDMDREGSTYTGKLGSISMTHFRAKTSNPHSDRYRHLAPGPSPSMEHCVYTAEHLDLHPATPCCGGPSFDAVSRQALVGRSELVIEPEKRVYCPGEPITIDVKLEAEDTFRYFDRLDPEYGFLTLWASDPPGPYRRLGSPIHADAPLSLEFMHSGLKSEEVGIGVWYGTGINQERSSRLVASFAGFEQEGEVVVSDPVGIRVLDWNSTLCDPVARELFLAPQARRFMWLLGGDHLVEGMRNLERISTSHRESIYAPYANLALGVNWIRLFHHVTEDGTMEVRRRKLLKAREHLLLAEDKRDLLPASYQALLDHHVPPDGRGSGRKGQ